MCHLTRDEASQFYSVHQGKEFFDRLVDFMTSACWHGVYLMIYPVFRVLNHKVLYTYFQNLINKNVYSARTDVFLLVRPEFCSGEF